MTTAAIYLRQSREKKDSVSIEAQLEKCKIICQLNSWDYIAYDDQGKSGKDLNRPGFQQMMQDIQDKKVQHIICYRLDRISRSMADFSGLIVQLEQYGVDFISATENFDTSTPLGRAMVNIIMTFAQLERETITERIVDNYYYRGNIGHWPGGTAPYGYSLVKKPDPATGKLYTALEINPEQARWVRYIFESYASPGGSVRKLLDDLNEKKVTTNRNAMWTSRVLVDLLQKPCYTANTVDIYEYYKIQDCNIVNDIADYDGSGSLNLYGKASKDANRHKRCRQANEMYLVCMEHTPIVAPELWLAVQRKKNSQKKPSPRSGTSKLSVLTGLLVCGQCGYRVSVTNGSRGYKAYLCSSKKNRGRLSCSSANIPQKRLDDMVKEDIIHHFTEPAMIAQVKQNYHKKDAENPEQLQRKNDLDLRLRQLDTEIDNLMQAISSGNSTMAKYANIHITELDRQRQEVLSQMQQLEEERNVDASIQAAYDFLYDYIDDFEEKVEAADFDELKTIYNQLIQEIIVNHEVNENIKIIYKI